MGLFGNINNNMTARSSYETAYNSARRNIIIVVAFTVINLIAAFVGGSTFFLFSAYIPYVLVVWGMFFCGLYPADYYEDTQIEQFLDKSLLAFFIGAAVIILALYILCFFLSKKERVGWLIAALALFTVDTILTVFIGGFQLSNLLNILFHIWVIVSLTLGIIAFFRHKKQLAAENAQAAQAANVVQDPGFTEGEFAEGEETEGEKSCEEPADSPILRCADPDVKHRVLLESAVEGHTVTYRQVKKVNELVIDGNVYDQYEAIVEFPHALKATIDGHQYEAGLDSTNHSYISFDGEVVAKKFRFI